VIATAGYVRNAGRDAHPCSRISLMNTITFSCSACQQVLRASADKVGRKAKCPGCRTMLVIPPSSSEPIVEVAELVEEALPLSRTNPDAAGDPEQPEPARYEFNVESELEGRAQDKRPQERDEPAKQRGPARQRRRRRQDDGQDRDEAVSDPENRQQSGWGRGEENDYPSERRRRQRTNVDALLRPPALALKIVAWVGAALSIVVVIVQLFIILGRAPGPMHPAVQIMPGPMQVFLRAVSAVGFTVSWSWLLLKASDCMCTREGYGWAVLGCLVAIAPGSVGWLGGLPVGVWGLVVLCRADVRSAFSSSKGGSLFGDLFSSDK
jgi:hypothetical protein